MSEPDKENQTQKPEENKPEPAVEPQPAPGAVDKPGLVQIEYEGYKFKADLDKIDDVEVLDILEEIEAGKPGKIITLMKDYLVGEAGYNKMRDYFVKKDGRFKMSTLANIYEEIFDKFDPKG